MLIDWESQLGSREFWGLAGIVLGAFIGFAAHFLRWRHRIASLKRILKAELESIRAQLPDKRDLLEQMRDGLRRGQVLPGASVHMPRLIYGEAMKELYPHLSLKQRNCLHVIHEHLRVLDDFMDSYGDKFMEAVREHQVDDPRAAFLGLMEDELSSIELVEVLAKEYCEGHPRDVFHVDARLYGPSGERL